MRNYIILNNQRSDEISGLIIQELAPISKPLQRTQVETIDGRDGDIVTPLGYAAYDKKITIGLYGNFDINEIIAYFATQGTAIFSNEPDKYYNYQILDQIDYERLVRFRVATVTMHVQPFKYSATEGTLTIDASDTVSGEGSEIALDNTAEAPFNVLRYKGNIIQDGTPTPSAPVPVQTVTGRQTVTVTGKNLLNVEKTTQTVNGVTFTINEDKTIIANGTASALVTFNLINTTFTLPSGQYYLSGCPSGGSDSTYRLDINNGADGNQRDYGNGRTFTLNQSTTINNVRIRIASGATLNRLIFKPMINTGSTAQPYEPYEAQNYEINLGKNLFDKDNVNQLTGSLNPNNKYEAGGANRIVYIPCEPNTTYTVQKRNDGDTNRFVVATSNSVLENADPIYGRIEDYNAKSITITTNASARFLNVLYYRTAETTLTEQQVLDSIQIEKGSTASSYAPYFTPIGLAAIGDYADEPVKVGDTWYIRRAVGKVVLDGSENWSLVNAGASNFYYNLPVFVTPKDQDIMPISNYFVGTPITNGNTSVGLWITNAGTIMARKETEQTLANFKTWLAGNNVTVYYVLATATDEEITDQDLIDQLDAFYNQAHAYKGHTHITATAADGNAPAILSVEVGEDNESTVTNAGNTTSRPILTIYGQGDIGVYINDVEVLDIALGDEQYITIDSVAMEAYKGTTANLKNRLVTGDYSKLALNAGDNKIYFTGIVTKYEISKYSRWL